MKHVKTNLATQRTPYQTINQLNHKESVIVGTSTLGCSPRECPIVAPLDEKLTQK